MEALTSFIFRPRTAVVGFALAMVLVPTGSSARDDPSHLRSAAQLAPFRIPVPSVASDGHPPYLSISAHQAYQGGALRVAASEGKSGTVTVLGRTTAMQPVGGGLQAYIGFGVVDPPGPATVTVTVTSAGGQVDATSWPISVLATPWTVDYITLPPTPTPDPRAPAPPPPPPDEEPLLPRIYAGVTPRMWTEGWAPPLPAPLDVSGYFGEQRSFNGGPVAGHHGGTDLAAEAGTPIYATNDGVVALSGLYLTRGNLVIIDHGGGVFSLYGHMRERVATTGEIVKKGEIIGYVGSTGLSTGPHLHWELSVGGILVDGLRWLDGTQGF